MSIAVTFISALTVIGLPAQTYLYGMVMLWFPVATCISKIVACIYYIPLIHRLRLVSIYEVCSYVNPLVSCICLCVLNRMLKVFFW